MQAWLDVDFDNSSLFSGKMYSLFGLSQTCRYCRPALLYNSRAGERILHMYHMYILFCIYNIYMHLGFFFVLSYGNCFSSLARHVFFCFFFLLYWVGLRGLTVAPLLHIQS